MYLPEQLIFCFLIGLLFDVTGNYDISFFVISGTQVIAASLSGLDLVFETHQTYYTPEVSEWVGYTTIHVTSQSTKEYHFEANETRIAWWFVAVLVRDLWCVLLEAS